MKKLINIGIFPLAHINVELFADPDTSGGKVDSRPDEVRLPVIVVGIKDNDWEYTVAVLLHEAMEFALLLKNHRYEPVENVCKDSGGGLFVFNHAEFTRACDYAAQFITPALPELSAVFNKHHKGKK